MQDSGLTLRRVVSADLIREARLRAGFTQAELAEHSGRERSVIARWEQGGSAPSLETLLDLLAVCGYDLPLELDERDDSALAHARESALVSPERRVERMLHARSKPDAEGDEPPRFDPYSILAILERHKVAYLLVGALARVIRGTDEIADDFELSPSRQPPNLTRLQRAVSELAGDEASAVPWASDATVTTEHGSLIIVLAPPGSRRGYTDLHRAASREPIGRGLRPPVASTADLAGMLSALKRDEDRATILALRRLTRLGT
jgi:transcriptional regulator with XRE-family HTH domain